MLRILFIIFLSGATLLTAAAWWFIYVRSGPQVTSSALGLNCRLEAQARHSRLVLHCTWSHRTPPTWQPWTIETAGFSLIAYPTVGFLPTTYGGSFMAFLNIWLPTVVTCVFWGACPFVSLRLRHRLRRKRGLCLKCGYDLTGNESGVCSECGTVTPPGHTIATNHVR